MKLIRKLHFWLGSFFAPSIIFFALSGSLQILGLHEGSGAIGWVTRLAQIHKSQTYDVPTRRTPPAAAKVDAPARPTAPAAEGEPRPGGGGPSRSVPLEIFFLLMAVSLITSSCLGIYMAVQYKRDRRVIIGLIAAGVVIPILLLFA